MQDGNTNAQSSTNGHQNSPTPSSTVSKKVLVTPDWAHFVAGGLGGMLGAIATCPLEVVKTRLQATGNKQSLMSSFRFGLGTFNALRALLKEEGVTGLYRGLGPNLIGVIPARAIYFFGLGTTKRVLVERFGFDPEATVTSFISGVVAGIAVTTTTQPIWLVKTRMQLQSRQHGKILYKNSLDAVKKIYQREGIRAFYIGMSASYLGITESCFQFVLYERFKLSVLRHKKNKGETGEDAKKFKLSPIEYVAASSAAKLIAAAVTYPHEVIRTRLREPGNTKYKGLFSGLATIAREEGFRGLYGGLGPHLVRVIPNTAIMFLTYELVSQALAFEIETTTSPSTEE